MANDFEEAALYTLYLLEQRLERLEYVLGGAKEQADGKPKSVAERMRKIEGSLQSLSSKTALIGEVQQLLSRHGDLIQPRDKKDGPPELGTSERLAMVLAEAPTFPATASQLKSLTDLPIPTSDPLASLASLRPRIEDVKERQYQQAIEISELRKRNGLLVMEQDEIFRVGQGRCFVEWWRRCKNAERIVTRAEYKKAHEDDSPSEETLIKFATSQSTAT